MKNIKQRVGGEEHYKQGVEGKSNNAVYDVINSFKGLWGM